MAKINQRILILCEGKTEELYAKALFSSLPRDKKRGIEIQIEHDTANNPKNLLAKAVFKKKVALRSGVPYNEIWLFFDNDGCECLKQIFEDIETHGFKFAYSSFSFEHWFILHFENCGRAFSSGEQVVNHLTKNHWADYKKTGIIHYKLLATKLETALKNANRINISANENFDFIHQRNPFFTIPDLIKKFDEFR